MKGKGSRLAILLAAVLTLVGAFGATAFAIDPPAYTGSVQNLIENSDNYGDTAHESVTQNSVKGNLTEAVTINYKASKLKYCPENLEKGRTEVAAWVGTRLLVPSNKLEANSKLILDHDGTSRSFKWSDVQDGTDGDWSYVDHWARVNVADVEYAIANNGGYVTYVDTFDRDGNGSAEITFTIKIDVRNIRLYDCDNDSTLLLVTSGGKIVPQHNWTGSLNTTKEGVTTTQTNTITCTDDNCAYKEEGFTVSLSAKDGPRTGSEYEATFNAENVPVDLQPFFVNSAFEYFKVEGETETPLSSAPVDEGTYKAKTKLRYNGSNFTGNAMEVTFQIASTHVHSWDIALSGTNSASVVCETPDCPYGTEPFVATLEVKNHVTTETDFAAKLTTNKTFPVEISVGEITYYKKEGGNWVELTQVPNTVGEYKAEVTVSEVANPDNKVTISGGYNITAPAAHDWDFHDPVDGVKGIKKVYCRDEDCEYHTNPVIVSVSVDDYYYLGKEINAERAITPNPDNEFSFTSEEYRKGSTVIDKDQITEPGIYNVREIIGYDGRTPASVYKYFRVVEATVVPATGLVYEDKEPLLSSASLAPTGLPDGVSIVYSLDNKAGVYSGGALINTGINAGEHTVWYKVVYTNSSGVTQDLCEPMSVTVNIAEAPVTVTAPVKATDLVYKGSDQGLIATAGALDPKGIAVLKYAVTTSNTQPAASEYTYASAEEVVKKNAGTYYVWYNVFANSEATDFYNNSNYKFVDGAGQDFDFSTPLEVDIDKATVKVQLPVGAKKGDDNLTFNGDDQDLVVEGIVLNDPVGDAEFRYAVSRRRPAAIRYGSAETVARRNANTYRVWFELFDKNAAEPLSRNNYKFVDENDQPINTLPAYVSTTIDPMAVSIRANDAAKYVNEDDPEFTFTATNMNPLIGQIPDVTEIFQEDVPSFYVTRSDKGEDPGVYRIDDYDYDEGGLANNYVINFNDEGKLTIKKSTDVPEAYDGLEYDGTEQELVYVPTLSDGTTFVLALGELPEEGKEPVEPAENKFSEDIPTGVAAGEYIVWYKAAKNGEVIGEAQYVNAEIAKDDLLIMADDADIVYGDQIPAPSASYYGLASADKDENNKPIDGVLSGTLEFAYDPELAEVPDAGEYVITPSGVEADNYDITFYPGVLTISKKEITPEWRIESEATGEVEDNPVTYTGKTFVACAKYMVGETEILEVPTGDYIETDAGFYTATVAIKDDFQKNYTIKPGAENFYWQINKREVGVSWTLYKDVDGETVPVTSPQTYYGFFFIAVAKCDVSGILTIDADSAEFIAKDAGAYYPRVKLTDAAEKNYTIAPGTESFFWEIEKAPLTVTAENKTIKYNESAGKLTVKYDGLVEGDTADDISGQKRCEAPDYSKGDDAGTYDIYPIERTFKSDNYEITFVPGTLTVEPSDVTITWNYDKPFVYSGKEQKVTPRVESGVPLADMLSVDADVVNDDTHTNVATVVGTYTAKAVLTGNAAKNYQIKGSDTLEWRISPRPAWIEWTKTSFDYDGTEHTVRYEIANVVQGESFDAIISGDKGTNAGSYKATITGVTPANDGKSKLENYSFYTSESKEHPITESTPASTNWTINKATATVTANDNTIYLYEEPKDAGYTTSGTASEDPIGTVTYTFNYKKNGKPGTYTITPVVTDVDPNYEVTTEEGTLTVRDNVNTLVAKVKASGKTKGKISWNKVTNAKYYDVYFARCNTEGKVYDYKKVASLKGTSYTKKNLKKGRNYKVRVIARDAYGNKISKSLTAHFVAGNDNGEETNVKSLSVNKTKVSLSAGSTFKIKASQKKVKANRDLLNSGHAPTFRYVSSSTDVATVSDSGKIKARRSGFCRVYVQTKNGIWKTIEVTVK